MGTEEIMSENLPNPEDVSVDELQNLIENLPEDKQQELISQLDVDVGDIGDVGGDDLGL
jgi:hypothetical protein